MNEQEHSIVIDEDKCTGCGECVEYCHVDAIAINEEKGVVEVIDLDASLTYATLPYSTGFETGFDMYWSATSERYNGRIRISPYNSPFTDSAHLAMDVKFSDYNYNRNDSI